MLNNKLFPENAFSFKKADFQGIEAKTNEFKNDSDEKNNKLQNEDLQRRGRIIAKRPENAHSGGVLLTFGMNIGDKESK